MVRTFQYPRHWSQPPVLSANSLRWSAAHCAKMLSPYDRIRRGKRWKSQGAKSGRMMVSDQPLPIENASGASLLQLQYAAEHCHEEGQYLRTTFLVVCSEWRNRIKARTAHLVEYSIVLDTFTSSLRAQNWQVRCIAIDRHSRDIAQHVCAKLHLILTVVLISRPIGLKKKIAIVLFFF